ncbi:MAG: helix-turn-helix transcriptional regulator [Bacteroidota bacterium]
MQNIEIQVVDLVILILSWSIILFALVLGVMLFVKQENRKLTNRILATLLLVAALFLIGKSVRLIGLANQFWSLYILPLYFQLSMPPLFYFYVKFKLNPENYFTKRDLPHWIIPIIQAVACMGIGCSSLAFKTKIWENGTLRMYYILQDVVFPVLVLCYGYASFRLLTQRKITNNESLKRWIKNLFKVLVAIFAAHLSMLFVYYHPNPNTNKLVYYLEHILSLSFLLFISLKAWDQYFPERIHGLRPIYDVVPQKTTDGHMDYQWFQTQTKRLFEQEQIFLNPDLNLAILCKAYGISKRSLSEHTQSVFNKNINELINHHRMQYVLKCLAEGQHQRYNILSIGYSAGFASKSTFYRVFKVTTGCTPSEYISQLSQ